MILFSGMLRLWEQDVESHKGNVCVFYECCVTGGREVGGV